MGFFSSIFDAAAEANDEVHGQRLLSHVSSTFESFYSLDERVVGVLGLCYIQIRDRLDLEMINWTREGRIRIAMQMQDQARKTLDTDVAGSYAKWLAGAWLESGERKSQNARAVRNTLNMYEEQLRRSMQEAQNQMW